MELIVNNLSKRFGEKLILDRLSFSMKSGDFMALVGSSDAGVLQHLEQLTRPWPPAETPRRWLLCPDLAPSALGKWQRQRWREWLERLDAAEA